MGAFDDITRKATQFLKSDKAQDALKSDKAESVSDKLLDGAAGVANKVTGGKHEDKISGARDAADKKIGNDGTTGSGDRGTADRGPTHGPAR